MYYEDKEENDLLSELNGEMGGVTVEAATPEEARELAAAAKEAKVDPLDVAPPKRKSAAARATEKAKADAAAKGTSIKGYAVTLEGDYLVASTEVPGKKMKKPYTITANLPSLEGALSVIKNKLLDKMLKMKYPGYITFTTHEIVDAKPLTADTPPAANIAYMTMGQLCSHIESRDIPIYDIEATYGDDVKALRAAVVDYTLNPKGFVEREAARQAERKEDAALEALNNIKTNTSPPTASK